MTVLTVLSTLALLLPTALATPEVLERNLAFGSPFLNHPVLAHNTVSVADRHHSAGRRAARKRQEQVLRPSTNPNTYTYVGYGLGVAYWDDASYIYAGGLNFTHSVASGDPYDTSVILWTRAEPADAYRVDVPMCVEYKVYADAEATGDVVTCGYALTNADVDFTVKVEAQGLQEGTWYYYQFSNCADETQKSPIGRTRTAPGKLATNVPTQRFSIYSCSNYPNGFFSAYSGPVKNQDTDYVIHLGDFIYESGTGGDKIGRVPSKGSELATLDDYRKRYSQYRLDPDLMAMSEQFPIITIWDDHEIGNNGFKAGSSNSNDSMATGGCAYSNGTVCWTDRVMHGKRAYHEWIPIRQVSLDQEGRIWRDFRFGDLVDVYALDTRYWDRDVTDLGYNLDYVEMLAFQLNTSRSATGPLQEQWLLDGWSASKDRGTTWRMVLNQVLFGSAEVSFEYPDEVSPRLDLDKWDTYQGQRARLLQYIQDNEVDNVIMYSGDSHENWLFENNLNTVFKGNKDPATLTKIQTTTNSYQSGQVVEYGGWAVSSDGWGKQNFENLTDAQTAMQKAFDHSGGLMYTETWHHGYMHVEMSYDQLITTYYTYLGINEKPAEDRTFAARFVQEAGMNQLKRPLEQPAYGYLRPGN